MIENCILYFLYGIFVGLVVGFAFSFIFWRRENKFLFKIGFLLFGIIIIFNIGSIVFLFPKVPYIKMLSIPDLRQMTDYSCGASALQTILFYYGTDIREKTLSEKLKTTPDEGTEPQEIERVAREYGLQVDRRQMTAQDLKNYIDKGIPVILAIQAWPDKKVDYKTNYDDGHYVVAIGYNQEGFLFEDPSTIGRGFIAYEELENRWHDIDKNGNKLEHLGIAIYGKPIAYKPNLIERIE